MNPENDPDGIPIPEFLFHIPDDATPDEKRYMRAQMVIQAAFHSFGDREILPGTATLERQELERTLATALAMLLAVDGQLKTPRDLRAAAEDHAKYIRQYAGILQSGGDRIAERLLDELRLKASSTN